jgi:hypothetical protein
MPKAIRQIRVEGNIAFVPLTKGYEAVIDAECVDMVAAFSWTASEELRQDGTVRRCSAHRMARVSGGRKKVFLHRLIFGRETDLDIDHIDGDALNNRRANLREVTKSQNQHNRRLQANASGLKGVTWDRDRRVWRARIGINGKRIQLGRFSNKKDAYAAYREASARLHGEFGRVA